MDQLEARHDAEMKELNEKSKELFKAASKKQKAVVEAQIIQMEFDLKAKHREEIDALEEQIERGDTVQAITSSTDFDVAAPSSSSLSTMKVDNTIDDEKAQVLSKKAKNQRKKERKSERETTRSQQLEDIKANAGESLRELELASLNTALKPLKLQVKEVISDGHCLYRSIADQLLNSSLLSSSSQQYMKKDEIKTNNEDKVIDFIRLRFLAADYIRNHAESFIPFIDSCITSDSSNDPNTFETYCKKVESVASAEWGGQLELRALSECLQRPIYIYEANAPVIKMGQEFCKTTNNSDVEKDDYDVIYLTYHRHYYALGEHYNSVTRINN